MNWWRLLRVGIRFLVLGIIVMPFVVNPEQTAVLLVPLVGAFFLLFRAFTCLPDFAKKPIGKLAKKKKGSASRWKRFWRWMIR